MSPFEVPDLNAFHQRRELLLDCLKRNQAIRDAQPLASIKCTLCLRINEDLPSDSSEGWARMIRLIEPDLRFLLHSPIPPRRPRHAGGEGRFMLYCDASTSESEIRRTLEALDTLAAIAREHLEAVGIDFGQYPDCYMGWLWLVYAVGWSRRIVGYSIIYGILSDATIDKDARRIGGRQPDGPGFFIQAKYRWGEWCVYRTDKQPEMIYMLGSDLLTSTCFAIRAIINWADEKVEEIRKWQSMIDESPASIAPDERAVGPPAEAELPSIEKKTGTARRKGRPPTADPEEDRLTSEQWTNPENKQTRSEFAKSKGLTSADLRRTIDRHRKKAAE
jgi:hypothetical protein